MTSDTENNSHAILEKTAIRGSLQEGTDFLGIGLKAFICKACRA
jgi:hypothetical protein